MTRLNSFIYWSTSSRYFRISPLSITLAIMLLFQLSAGKFYCVKFLSVFILLSFNFKILFIKQKNLSYVWRSLDVDFHGCCDRLKPIGSVVSTRCRWNTLLGGWVIIIVPCITSKNKLIIDNYLTISKKNIFSDK